MPIIQIHEKANYVGMIIDFLWTFKTFWIQLLLPKRKVATIMIFESKEQELMFMNVLWLRLLYLQEHLKETGELEFMQVVRECNWRCSNKIERLKDEI